MDVVIRDVAVDLVSLGLPLLASLPELRGATTVIYRMDLPPVLLASPSIWCMTFSEKSCSACPGLAKLPVK